jgi:hypothetical protein
MIPGHLKVLIEQSYQVKVGSGLMNFEHRALLASLLPDIVDGELSAIHVE